MGKGASFFRKANDIAPWTVISRNRTAKRETVEFKRINTKVSEHTKRINIENPEIKALGDIKDITLLENDNYFFQKVSFKNMKSYLEFADDLFANSAAHLNLDAEEINRYFEIRKKAVTQINEMGDPKFNNSVEDYVKKAISEIKQRYGIDDDQLREINYLLQNNPSFGNQSSENIIKHLKRISEDVLRDTKNIRQTGENRKRRKPNEKQTKMVRIMFYRYLKGQNPESVRLRSEHFEKCLGEKNMVFVYDAIITEADDMIKRIENMTLRIETNREQFEIDHKNAERAAIDILIRKRKQ